MEEIKTSSTRTIKLDSIIKLHLHISADELADAPDDEVVNSSVRAPADEVMDHSSKGKI